ncbi:MAG: hypothetical protein PW845_00325 [Pseudomonas sp.]|uniref:hypothetical protein n=1 Tax=Pseudomonas abieticivorans TaxID=2931382 RepID=UPI0020BE43C4|nr:hypothetical protein [Pseudomonas sp. PIA16]MDE1163846.1 hypothetical protein [Pseudomonas sp.]
MNSALYLLNALALVAVLAFHFQGQGADPAVVHVQAEHFMQRPVARLAVMNADSGRMQVRTSQQDVGTAMTAVHTDRYTF